VRVSTSTGAKLAVPAGTTETVLVKLVPALLAITRSSPSASAAKFPEAPELIAAARPAAISARPSPSSAR
jgi:hypothetical protein